MLLTIDIGNTSTQFGVFEQSGELRSQFRLSTNRNMSADELGIQLVQLLQFSDIRVTDMAEAIVCSVVPELDYAYRVAADRFLDTPITFVTRETPTGMPIRYRHPEEVGADRIVDAVGAYERYHEGLIIVDFGTAITFDVVSPAGEYLGGCIAPGLKIALDALFQRTAKLPRIDLTPPERALGKTTIESMQAGIFYGYAGLVDRIVDELCDEVDFTPRVLGTGGHIRLIEGLSTTVKIFDKELTLHGLRVIHQRQKD
jgi:type III pantothenate kinase